MANSRQARKRAKQADKARARNMSHRSRFRTQLKRVEAAIQAGDIDGATASYQKAVPVIDAMAGRGLIHKNKAARHKSRLNAKIKALAAASG